MRVIRNSVHDEMKSFKAWVLVDYSRLKGYINCASWMFEDEFEKEKEGEEE